MLGDMIGGRCINRIRLEFKVEKLFRENELLIGINRIRLEFKVYYVEERADV